MEIKSSRKEKEKKFREEGRMPPGQVLTDKFPVLHYGNVPSFDESQWTLKMWGEVEREVSLTLKELIQLPRTKITYDLHCVTRWSKFNTQWEGIRLNTLISEGIINLKPSANFLVQHAENEYTCNLPLDIALSDTFLLATHYEGEPLPMEHSFPLRGLIGAIPEKKGLKDVYLWKGAKWLWGLEFLEMDKKGFWELAGYHNEGDIWKEQKMAADM